MPIFQMSERFYFLSTETSIKLYHHLAGLQLPAAPGRSKDWGRRKSGRKESRGAQLTSELESFVMPKMFPLAVKALHKVKLGLLQCLDLMEGDKEGVGTRCQCMPFTWENTS